MGSETDDSASETGFFENPGNVAILSSVIGVVTLGSAAAIVFKVIRCESRLQQELEGVLLHCGLWFTLVSRTSDSLTVPT